MPRELGKNRPRSTIAEMIEFDEIEKATEEGPVHLLNESKLEEPSAVHPTIGSTVSTPQRTGEHTNIQKMYRLTPTAHQILRELTSVISSNVGFEVNNSTRGCPRRLSQSLGYAYGPEAQQALSTPAG